MLRWLKQNQKVGVEAGATAEEKVSGFTWDGVCRCVMMWRDGGEKME